MFAHNKFVNERTSCWTAQSATSQQRGPLQRRYSHKEIPHMDSLRLLISIILLTTVTACSDSDNSSANDTTSFVFASRGSIQCVSRGIDPEESALDLISSGIDVLSTTCGVQADIATPAVCGAGSTEFIAHEIRGVNVPDAVEVGFVDIENIEGEYELQECITSPLESITPVCSDSDGDGVCDAYDEYPLDPAKW
jgi:hypothetical protein